MHDATAIPVSALKGDNVVDRTDAMPWYAGPTLLEHLETVELAGDRNLDDRRFPVQWVIRPMADAHHDYRGYAGQVAGGVWRAGDEVVVLPSGLRSTVAAVEAADGELDEALPGQSVTIRLEDDVDVSRGDLLADPASPPIVARELRRARLLDDRAAARGRARGCSSSRRRAPFRRASTRSSRSSTSRRSKIARRPGRMELNDLGVVRFRLAEPLVVDPYARNRATGAFILIDESTNDTVGAGMVVEAS